MQIPIGKPEEPRKPREFPSRNHTLAEFEKLGYGLNKAKACESKTAYPGFEEAKSTAEKIGSSGDLMEPYLCSFCNKFHLGHDKRK